MFKEIKLKVKKIWQILIILLIFSLISLVIFKNNSVTGNGVLNKFRKILGLGYINEDEGGSSVAVLRGEIEEPEFIENYSYL